VLPEVLKWDLEAFALEQILDDLSKTVNQERVFLDWERRSPKTFPEIIGSTPDTLLVSGTRRIDGATWRPQRFPIQTAWVPEARVADIFVASSAEDLSDFDHARMVIIFGSGNSDVRAVEKLAELRGEKLTRCVVEVEAELSSSGPWMDTFFDTWSRHGTTLDDALIRANKLSGSTSRVVCATQTFILQSTNMLQPFAKRGATGEQSASDRAGSPRNSVDMAYSDRSALKNLPTFYGDASTPPPQARVLNAEVRHHGRVVKVLPLEGVISISLSVLVKRLATPKLPAFPDDEVEWDGDSKTLQAHMLEYGQEAVTQALVLPRTGDSQAALFGHKMTGKAIDLRFILTDGPKILQTARVFAEPGEAIKFYIETVTQSVSQNKTAFDVALLVNESLGGRPSITAVSADAIHLSALSDTDAQNARNEILRILYQAVNNPEAPIGPPLLDLASQGRLLLEYLKETIQGWPKKIERVQLLTQTDAFFPMEYLYEGQIPESGEAELCTERHACLTRGTAVPNCPIREAAQQLCPMGFIGLSAIVERHTWHHDRRQGIWLSSRLELGNRKPIKNLKNAVFTASDRADMFEDNEASGEVVRTSDISTLLGSECLPDWNSWKNAISAQTPSLLVMLLHTENSRLVIGEGDSLMLGALSGQHVGLGLPVTVAIGCSTGLAKMAGANLPALLIKHGAQLVFAAMTDVLGRHAVRAARDVAVGLRVASESPTATTVGQLVTRIRADLLKDDIALGLALIAFGDADVVLGGS
jgi:hypothetical protein